MAKPTQVISAQQWDEWARAPATVEFTSTLREAVEEAKEAWAQWAYLSENREVSERMNTAALAEVSALRKVIDQLEDYKTESQHHE